MKKFFYAAITFLFSFAPGVSMAQVAAGFYGTPTSGCSPLTVSFTDTSTGSPKAWEWDFGDGTTSTIENPNHVYITTGSYTVKLVVTDSVTYDSVTDVNYITVAVPPTVNFYGDSELTCPPFYNCFTNKSIAGAPGATYVWNFGDVSGTDTSSLKNPCHVYNTPGCFSVTLIETDTAGCSSFLTRSCYVHVDSVPAISFTDSGTTCTYPATVTFTPSVKSAEGDITWIWGDGTASVTTATVGPISHTYSKYPAAGGFTAELVAHSTATVPCYDTFAKFIAIDSFKAIFKTVDSVCLGGTISQVNLTPYLSSDNFVWTAPGFSPGITTNPYTSFTAISSGKKTIVLAAYDKLTGCADTASQNVYVDAGPTASLTPITAYYCAPPFDVAFSNTSTVTGHQNWNFGDPSSGGLDMSTIKNPSHTFDAFGNYTVVLSDTDLFGCYTTANSAISIDSPTLTLSTDVDSGCTPLVVNWSTSLSLPITYTVTKIEFGDGTSATSPGTSGTHTYTDSKVNYMIVTYKLPSTDGGCTYTAIDSVRSGTTHPHIAGATGITPPYVLPDSSVSAYYICPQDTEYFNSYCTNCTSFYWTIPSYDSIATDVFTVPGNFLIRFVGTVNGCSDTFTTNFIHVQQPSVTFTPSLIDCSNRFAFSFNSGFSTGVDSLFKWKFGDGDSSTLADPTHIYTAAGTDTVTLYGYAKDSNSHGLSCHNFKTSVIHIFNLTDTITAADSFQCINHAVNFTGGTLPYAPYGPYYEYIWNFGDGTVSTVSGSRTTSHTYTANGVYTVALKVYDFYGCADSTTKFNYITISGPNIDVTASALAGCTPLVDTFLDNSTDLPGVTISKHMWTFPDTSFTITTDTLVRVFDTNAITTIILQDVDSHGCSASDTLNVNTTHPIAYFFTSLDTTCPYMPIQFTDTTTATNYTWYYGDGTSDTGQNPMHTYSADGTYTVTFVVSNFGCPDSMTRVINIRSFVADFTLSDTATGCPPLTPTLTVLPPSDSGTYTYEFKTPGATSPYSFGSSAYPFYSFAGDYDITLVAVNQQGCMDSASHYVHVHGPKGIFSYSPIEGCHPLTVYYRLDSAANLNYKAWQYDGVNTIYTSADTLNHTFLSAGSFGNISIIIGDTSLGQHCFVTIPGSDTIKVDGITANFYYSADSFCTAGIVQFTDTATYTSAPVTMRSWNFGDPASGVSNTDTTHNPSHTYNAPGTYHIRYIVQNGSGCFDTVSKIIGVLQNPVVTIDSSQTICTNQPVALTLYALGTHIDSLRWSSYTADTLSCDTCHDVHVLPKSTDTFTVIAFNRDGCMDTAKVTIVVNPAPSVMVSSDTTICSGDTITLNSSGSVEGTRYTWLPPATGLSCDTCNSTLAYPKTTTTYCVRGYEANRCSDTECVKVNVKPLPVLSPINIPAEICLGGSDTLVAIGTNTTGVYVWGPSGSCSECDTNVVAPSATTTYTLSAVGTNGCPNTAQIVVIVNPLPNPTASNEQICIGNTVQLMGTGALTYVWRPDSTLSCDSCQNPVSNTVVSTNYTLIGTDVHGCVDSSIVTVSVVDSTMPRVTPRYDTLCIGNSVGLTATGGVQYLWEPSTGLDDNTSATPVASPDTTTTYVVYIKENECFNDTDSVTVQVDPIPIVILPPSTTIIAGNSLEINSSVTSLDSVTYLWTPADGVNCTTCPDVTVTPNMQTTTYTVTVSTHSGCVVNADITVSLKCDNSQVFIPNTFTPNGDGLNDRFYPSLKGITMIRSFRIYNRWGQLVYDVSNIPPNDAQYGWDGSYKNHPLAPDVFVYIIDAECEIGGELEYKGDISLVR